MQRLVGQTAHSDFRLSELFIALQKRLPGLKNLQSHYEYVFTVGDNLTEPEKNLLETVLMAKAPESDNAQMVWVAPRFGTQSPWGSKALDILHHVGLEKVSHIERVLVYQFQIEPELTSTQLNTIYPLLHDRMTESIVSDWQALQALFTVLEPQPYNEIDILNQGIAALTAANKTLGLALSDDEIDYLLTQYLGLNRNPTDVELMMFAQANSEHCRHKIFKAKWIIDGEEKADSLFGMIKNTYEKNSKGILSAYTDNAAVFQGYGKQRFYCTAEDKVYRTFTEEVHALIKVETHNHPTAIEPFAGAGTGQGGEIRDEGATGLGSKPKVGLCGFTVSNLHITDAELPWEGKVHYPTRIASALDIMLKAPIGAAAFNNEFGRPNICGYFRTFEQPLPQHDGINRSLGYHKPIMIAGGLGNIKQAHVKKQNIPDGALLIVLGGPAMKIGLGGGAASSMASGASEEELDFASVQRQNPEMERRCQEVIDRCWAMKNNPIISIHDVGAGGLANALPELVNDSNKGAVLELRKVPNAEKGMNPLEIWCNESQERYVLAILPQDLALFTKIAERERCPFSVLGTATTKPQLKVTDDHFKTKPIDLPQAVLFGNPPKMVKNVKRLPKQTSKINTQKVSLEETITRVLQCPTVADKTFLITIGDRSVGGLTARDQMVGPWQVPVADCAVSATHYSDITGEAMSMGERSPIAALNAAASAKMAVAEAVLNILAADVKSLADIRLSCNWMAAAKVPGFDVDLYDAVQAVGKELCPDWGITIPVGKDSMSMKTQWQDDKGNHEVIAPLSLVVSAFAPVDNIRQTLTPELDLKSPSHLLFIDLAQNQQRLGGSIYAQVTEQIGETTPNIDSPQIMKQFIKGLNQIKEKGMVSAYHDRSDGGLLVTLMEMAFASRTGLDIDISSLVSHGEQNEIAALFNEECGVVIQVKSAHLEMVKAIFKDVGIETVYDIAKMNTTQQINIRSHDKAIFSQDRTTLQRLWSKTSFLMQNLRDNPQCAKQAYDALLATDNPGLFVKNATPKSKPYINTGVKPKVAILREQGVNGHQEMAAAFTLAGFEAIDVTMSDLLQGASLDQFQGLAACGGFSYGDVLGAGKGWANTILYRPQLRALFTAFFERQNTFTLGVCNGCQMLSSIKEIIPGAHHWPLFVRNLSEQFEARLSLVEVCKSNSILLNGMEGAILPIVVSHGEGRTDFSQNKTLENNAIQDLLALRYVDHQGKPTEYYPYNPNGSAQGMTGFTTEDGRVTIMMPHPERMFKSWQLSWHPKEWTQDSPWMTMFTNARDWLK
jgi:phosphoribosylformylglycinamidine synthase